MSMANISIFSSKNSQYSIHFVEAFLLNYFDNYFYKQLRIIIVFNYFLKIHIYHVSNYS